MKGLAPHTQSVFESVSMLECLKPYLLVGGTALSLQIGTRQSEDLDFMRCLPIVAVLQGMPDLNNCNLFSRLLHKR